MNLVSGNQAPVVRHFMTSKGGDRFNLGEWNTLVTGAPILDGATAAFDCELDEVHDGFTHSILIGKVKDCRISSHIDETCLLWHGRDFAEPSRLPA